MSCSISSTVTSAASERISAAVSSVSPWLMPWVGSSSISTLGRPASATATSRRRCSPCESCATASARLAGEAETLQQLGHAGAGDAARSRSAASICAQRSSTCAASRRFSATGRSNSRLVIWNERATPAASMRYGRRAGAFDALDEHGAGLRPQRAGDEIEQGRLAGAVRPDDGGDAIARGGEADAVDGAQAAEADREIARLEHRRGHGGALRTSRRSTAGRTSPISPRGRKITAPMNRSPMIIRWCSVQVPRTERSTVSSTLP